MSRGSAGRGGTGGRRSATGGPRWSIEDILARTDLARLLDEYAVPATHAVRGRRWHCPVPDHEDRRASVTIHTDARGHERWRCWSGDNTHRGDALDLVMVAERAERREAIDILARRAGLDPHAPAPSPPPRRRPAVSRPKVVPLDPAVVAYAEACERMLYTSAGRPVQEWLAGRGIGPEVARLNRVGADPGRERYFRRWGLPYGATTAATFPALDQAGNIRYVQTRYLDPGEGGDKYDNPATRLGTNPRLSWAVPVESPRPDVLVVCEGTPDALIAAQAGFHAVAVLGSQAPDRAVAARIATRAARDDLVVVAVTDNDQAGTHWGKVLGSLLTEHDHPLTLVTPPVGNDLNDWARQDPAWDTRLSATLAGTDGPADGGTHLELPVVE